MCTVPYDLISNNSSVSCNKDHLIAKLIKNWVLSNPTVCITVWHCDSSRLYIAVHLPLYWCVSHKGIQEVIKWSVISGIFACQQVVTGTFSSHYLFGTTIESSIKVCIWLKVFIFGILLLNYILMQFRGHFSVHRLVSNFKFIVQS